MLKIAPSDSTPKGAIRGGRGGRRGGGPPDQQMMGDITATVGETARFDTCVCQGRSYIL